MFQIVLRYYKGCISFSSFAAWSPQWSWPAQSSWDKTNNDVMATSSESESSTTDAKATTHVRRTINLPVINGKKNLQCSKKDIFAIMEEARTLSLLGRRRKNVYGFFLLFLAKMLHIGLKVEIIEEK